MLAGAGRARFPGGNPSMNAPDPEGVRRVAVLGAGGVVGASWAALFLHHGQEVCAQDPAPGAPERVKAFVERARPALAALFPHAPASGELRFVHEVAGAVPDAEFVQENAPENEELKRRVLAEADALAAPGTVIASSTSALLRSRIVSDCQREPGRVIVAHPFNPPHLLPLVELVGETPDSAAVTWAVRFFKRLGKRPVVLRREALGHIANRLTSALYREAVSLVEQGVASVADIDAAVASGPGLRWAIFGPHLLYHLGGGPGGIAHYLEHLGPSQERRWAELGNPKLSPELREVIIAGVREEAAGRSVEELETARDRALLAVLAALRQTTPPGGEP